MRCVEVVDAVGDRIDVLVDGGIRRGTDVLKALALGARAVLVGRPVLCGLAVDGAAGAQRVLEILLGEFDNALELAGAPDAGRPRPQLRPAGALGGDGRGEHPRHRRHRVRRRRRRAAAAARRSRGPRLRPGPDRVDARHPGRRGRRGLGRRDLLPRAGRDRRRLLPDPLDGARRRWASSPTVERLAAERFADAAVQAGVGRIVYLGGILPGRRAAVGASGQPRCRSSGSCSSAVPDSVALRASIVIGARSRSFRFLVRLVERLPVLAVPAWHDNRTQPIDERDIDRDSWRAAATSDAVGGRSLDVGGPDVVTYGQLIDRIRELMLVGRPTISFRRLTVTPIAEQDRGGDRRRTARADRSTDGKPEHRPAAPRRRRASACSASGCTRLDAAIERALRDMGGERAIDGALAFTARSGAR